MQLIGCFIVKYFVYRQRTINMYQDSLSEMLSNMNTVQLGC